MAQRSAALFIRGMRPDIVREAKAAAAKRGTTLAKLVTDSLERTLDGEPESGDFDGIEQAMRWYARHRTNLLRRYKDKYVAIDRGRVIDSDADFGALAERVFSRLGFRSVFMPRVSRTSSLVRVRSPRKAAP